MSVGNSMQVKRDLSIRQVILWSKPVVFILIWLLGVSHSFAETRKCLYTNKKASVQLQEIINNIQNLDRQPLSYTDLIPKDAYFVRIVPLNTVLTTDNKIKRDAYLGGKPFIFLTIPESLYGVSLLNLLFDLGYDTAEDIIAPELNERHGNIKVAVVFRYPRKITVSKETDGHLPENWRDRVYTPTWNNIFALFNNLAKEAVIEPEPSRNPTVDIMSFQNERERNLVLGLTPKAKKRIASTPYALLKGEAGEDWQYRQLLERELSVLEHFRGNGRTINEVKDPNGERAEDGIPEFVGPNQRITDLPEVAIINLGRLILSDTFTYAKAQIFKQRGGQGQIASENAAPKPDHNVTSLFYGLVILVGLVVTLLLARMLWKSRVAQTLNMAGGEGQTMNAKERRSWRTPEFLLVIVMLGVLALLVFFILIIPPLAFTGISGNNLKDMAKEFLEYRKTLLSIVVTAFGAWVGAGAAYYFGRENLAEASRSLLAMKEPSAQERLRNTPIRLIPPRSLDWKVKTSDELKSVIDKLKAEPKKWFIPIIKNDGTLENVIHEEAVWRLVDKDSANKTPYDEIMNKKVSDVLTFLKDNKLERLMGIYVPIYLDKNAGEANELMKTKDVSLAIIVDETGKPTHYVDTGDVRRLLLQAD